MKWVFRLMTFFVLTIMPVLTLSRRENSGWIAFESELDGARAIFLNDGRQLTPDDLCGSLPRWSPDGAWIAVLSACMGENNLYLLRPNGSRQQITGLPHILGAAWSPDGSRLVARSDASRDLHIVEADGGVSLLASGYYAAQWSPDADWIYARPFTDALIKLERLNLRTGESQHLLTASSISALSWSPDGSQIVLRIGSNELALMTPDGSQFEPMPIAAPSPEIREVIWSPSGEWIVFSAGEEIAWQIYRIRPDGGALQRLTQRSGNVWQIQWSSDSEWLLFSADYDGQADAYRLRVDGSSLQNLTPGPRKSSSPQYAPVSGLEWHPFWLMIAALMLTLWSVMGRIRP
jgi:Tol biopolymer transport system component